MITATRFRFARVKVHPKLDLSGWYLVLDDYESLMEMHRSACGSLFMKFHRDPHLFDQKTWRPVSDQAQFYNPVKLGAGWLNSAQMGMLRHGVIYMNRQHGMLYGDNVEIIENRESEKLVFPDNDDHKDGVRIVVSKWGNGQHYYLNANQTIAFSQPKFDTAEEALAEARVYAFEANIKIDETRHYSRDGD